MPLKKPLPNPELQKWSAQNPPGQKRAVLATYYLARKACTRKPGEPDKALAALESFIPANPGNPLLAGAFLLQGNILLDRQKISSAILKSFQAAMRQAPDRDFLAGVELSCGNAYFKQGEFALAQGMYRSAAGHSARLWQQAVFNSALSWLNQANYDKFWSDYKELSARFPNSEILSELKLEEGLLQARSSDSRAEKTLRDFIANFPRHLRVAEARLALAEIEYLSPFQNLERAGFYLKASNDSPQTPETRERAEYLQHLSFGFRAESRRGKGDRRMPAVYQGPSLVAVACRCSYETRPGLFPPRRMAERRDGV